MKIFTEKEKLDYKQRVRLARLKLGSGLRGEAYKRAYQEYLDLISEEWEA